MWALLKTNSLRALCFTCKHLHSKIPLGEVQGAVTPPPLCSQPVQKWLRATRHLLPYLPRA